MKRKITYTVWGRGDFDRNGTVAMCDEDESPAVAAIKSVARRSGLHVITARSDGTQVCGDRIVAHQRTATLGRPCPGGGWLPLAEIWVSVRVG
ncbi:MAG: hypothetical protein WC683_19700 [bacterium]